MQDEAGNYRSSLQDFYKISEIAISISNNTHGREVDSWKLEYGSYTFTKICLHSMSLRAILPSMKPDGGNKPGIEFWDISSIASLIRSIIDTYYAFYYLSVDNRSDEEDILRQLIWDYHGEMQRLDLLKKIKSSNPAVKELKNYTEILKEKIEQNDNFKNLNTNQKKNIVEGKRALLLTNSEMSERAGIDSYYYKANFNSLSAYTHAHPFAINQLSNFRAGNDEALNLINSKLETCTGYICHAVNDMVKLFPDQKTKIDHITYELIEKWIYIFKNFNS